VGGVTGRLEVAVEESVAGGTGISVTRGVGTGVKGAFVGNGVGGWLALEVSWAIKIVGSTSGVTGTSVGTGEEAGILLSVGLK